MNRRSATGTAVLVLALGVPLVVLVVCAGGGLGPSLPPLREPKAWASWAQGTDPVDSAFSLLRLLTAGLGLYLSVTLLAGLVLRARGATRWVAAADRVTPAALRRLMAMVVVAGMSGPSVAHAADPTIGITVTTVPAAPAADTAPETTVGTTAPITMRRLLAGEDVPAPTQPSLPSTPTPESETPPSAVPETPAEDEAPNAPHPATGPTPAPDAWMVEPGDCFWTIADEVLSRAWGRPPSDAEIVPYWTRLIDANRSDLVAPGNPDLVLPGQTFTVPLPPEPPR